MSEDRRARHSFKFIDCVELAEILGMKAWDEQNLLEIIEEVPVDSINYHVFSTFLRHKYLVGPYPNDFATWAALHVRDRVLGERLGVIDPYEFESVEALRGEIVTTIDDHLSKLRQIPRVIDGEAFYFMRSRTIEVPGTQEAWTLADFLERLREVDVGVIYFHFFEARRRGKKQSDFAAWFEAELDRPDLARKLAEINPYMRSLEGIREAVLQICMEGSS